MSPAPPLPPRYSETTRIGHGGMGDLFCAVDTELRRAVAIKLLAERYANDPAVCKRFKREALTAARLSGHPRVVTIYDVGDWEGGRPFIVMELMRGGTVADRMRSGRVTPSEALAWLEQAAEALDAAHEEGIVHRDVKPANLLLNSRGEVHVGDFGIARVLDDTTGGMTETGTVLGTAGYLAPEQAAGNEATAASDVYSLGVVAYELLVGRRPFENSSPTAEAAAHINEPVPSASAEGDVPRAVDPVFERVLAKRPSERYETAAEFVDELRTAFAAGEQETRVLAVPPAPAQAAAPLRPARRSRRGRTLIALAALGLLAGGAIAGALLAGTNGGDKQARGNTAVRTTVRREVRTITRTLPGTTASSVVTVTTPAPAPPPPPTTAPPPPPPAAAPSTDGHTLNDRGFSLMKQGRYDEALAPLQQAVRDLQGTGPSDPYEAYANFNLGFTLLHLGQCSEAIPLFDRAEQLEGHLPDIVHARNDARKCARG